MKSERNIFIAFLLNLIFAVFEFVGGALTGSVAILSDAVHDLGDATSIGVAFFLEHHSRRRPDDVYTYGYLRYSVIGSVLTTLILLVGSVLVIVHAVERLLSPVTVHYDGMIVLAVVGVAVNLIAALVTRHGESLNQKAVNLHMLEDVLGWVVVLIGAVVMRFTNWWLLDPLMSIGVAVFILINALRNLKEALDLFLEKAPREIGVAALRDELCRLENVKDVHHVHVWSLDGHHHYATLHVVTDGDAHTVKHRVRDTLREHGIGHATLELESSAEHCHDTDCTVEITSHHHHHHHHH